MEASDAGDDRFSVDSDRSGTAPDATPFHQIGHSYGGAVALRFEARLRRCDQRYCCLGHEASPFQKKFYLLEEPLAGGLMLQKEMILALKWDKSGARNAGSH
jgi:pimeloyl-ACP methyl ester carboxylesterase